MLSYINYQLSTPQFFLTFLLISVQVFFALILSQVCKAQNVRPSLRIYQNPSLWSAEGLSPLLFNFNFKFIHSFSSKLLVTPTGYHGFQKNSMPMKVINDQIFIPSTRYNVMY